MLFKDLPIQLKLMRVILLISSIILFVTCAAFFAYEIYTFRQATIQKLSALGEVIATNSTAALAFDNRDDAKEILAALKADPHIVAAGLYDIRGNLFAYYPDNINTSSFPVNPSPKGYRFQDSFLEGFQAVIQGVKPLGTIYIKSDLGAMYERLELYGIIVILVIGVSLLLAFLLSKVLQKSISTPILALAQAAKAISNQGDYSVRATKLGNDELGLLTDAFNQMLIQIQEQNHVLSEFNQNLEQKVIARTTELEAANNELESFSYSISHDLRAPVRAIHGYSNIFLEDHASQINEEAKKIINVILTNADKMGHLIDDLLAFSRLGRKDLIKSNFSMNDVVMGMWDDLYKMEKGREIELILKPLPEGYAERTTIKQVWANLLSNALKYTRNKEKTIIEISFEEKEDEIIYCISDNGTGFDMQYYDKLFGVFQRLHSQEEFEGTGVGLAIVQRIIEKHGGKIWAKGAVNEGATFCFTLKKRI